MAQTNYTPISLYYSATASATPTAGNLVAGELALNTNDGKLYYKDSSGVVQTLASKATSSGVFTSVTDSGLTSGRVTYAGTGGLLTDSANMTFNGTTLTLANDASISGLTVGKGGGSPTQTTAVGYQSLLNQTGAGDYNSAFGYQAGYGITTAQQMVAIGRGVMAAGTVTGTAVTGVGNFALNALTTGSSNTAVGNSAGQAITTGSYNTVIGDSALRFNTSASNNTAVGYLAAYSTTTGYNQTSLGAQAGYSNTTGLNSTSIGSNAGYSMTGDANTLIGQGAGYYITSGAKNTVLGRYTGNQGGLDIRTASNYIVLSDGDGNPNLVVDNNKNTSIGGPLNVSSANVGKYVTAINSYSGGYCLSLGANTGDYGSVGYNQGYQGSSYKYIGSDTASFIKFASGQIQTFTASSGTAGTTLTPTTGPYVAVNGTSWTNSSDERLKNITGEIQNGLSKVCTLRAAEYTWKSDENAKPQVGLIAQDVLKVLPEVVVVSDKEFDGTANTAMGINYDQVVPLLVAAIKELKAEFDAYKATHP